MKFIIVSGLSGSGKSVALDTLEDCGFYCIDNLPVALLDVFAEEVIQSKQSFYNHTAIGIDSRNQTLNFNPFFDALKLIEEHGIGYEILFLQAENRTLIKRFSETRRKHPLTDAENPLSEAIVIERHLLEPIASRADLVIDTTWTNIHQLREQLRSRVAERNANSLSVLLQSFAFKNGIPMDSDFMFDARCLPNPYWEAALRTLTGKDAQVAEFLSKSEDVSQFLEDVGNFLQRWIPHFKAENRKYLGVAIGCTGGQHRSTFIVESLAKQLKSSSHNVIVRHRELP